MEIFDTLLEVQVLTKRWRRYYNIGRPHSTLNYHPPPPRGRSSHGTNIAGSTTNGSSSVLDHQDGFRDTGNSRLTVQGDDLEWHG